MPSTNRVDSKEDEGVSHHPFLRNPLRRRGADGPEKCHGIGAEKGLYAGLS